LLQLFFIDFGTGKIYDRIMVTELAKLSKTDQRHLKGFIGALAAFFIIFFIVPIFEKNFYTHLILQFSFATLILSTIYTFEKRAWPSGLFFLIPFFLFDSLSFYTNSPYYLVFSYGISLIFTFFAIIVLMKKIFAARHIDAHLIFSAVMIYFLSGILFANFYFIENIISPGSFQGIGAVMLDNSAFPEIYEQYFNLLYYSLATLATLGMGDITPLHHLAKSLTAMEAMFGQLFVAIIIAKLVSVWWILPEGKKH
jgi:voltage-gated potassium channel